MGHIVHGINSFQSHPH